jgi:transcriptional regulator
MYIPNAFRVDDRGELLAFMRAHSFATLVSVIDGEPFATHLPLAIEERGDAVVVTGHVAKANPQARAFVPGGDDGGAGSVVPTLAIFSGPHAYVSPTVYEKLESVPTWNYIAVHAAGVPRAVEAGESPAIIEAMLDSMISQYDAAYREQWRSLPEPFRQGMMRGIIGFEMVITRLEGKYKLSQNRSHADQRAVAEWLAAQDDSAARAVAQAMPRE